MNIQTTFLWPTFCKITLPFRFLKSFRQAVRVSWSYHSLHILSQRWWLLMNSPAHNQKSTKVQANQNSFSFLMDRTDLNLIKLRRKSRSREPKWTCLKKQRVFLLMICAWQWKLSSKSGDLRWPSCKVIWTLKWNKAL